MDWINIKTDKRPLCYQTGDWDGKKSDVILCYNEYEDELFTATCYEGTMDGDNFFECYDENDFEVTEQVTHWCNINKPNE